MLARRWQRAARSRPEVGIPVEFRERLGGAGHGRRSPGSRDCQLRRKPHVETRIDHDRRHGSIPCCIGWRGFVECGGWPSRCSCPALLPGCPSIRLVRKRLRVKTQGHDCEAYPLEHTLNPKVTAVLATVRCVFILAFDFALPAVKALVEELPSVYCPRETLSGVWLDLVQKWANLLQ